MEAIVRTGIQRGELELRDVPEPTIEHPEDVVVQVAHAGLCGSDVGAYLGKPEYDDYMPIPSVLGHEFAGVVERTGDDVQSVDIGDRVVVWPAHSCGRCYQCRMGQGNVCPNPDGGDGETGGFAPRTRTRVESLYPVPNGVPLRHAALTEPLGVTYRTVNVNAAVEPGETVLVQGPGPMGTFSACLAQTAGASVVVSGLERDAHRLDVLDELGFETTTVATSTPDELVAAHTDAGGFDIVIDATGAATGVESAIAATRPGGRVVVVGVPSGDITVDGTALVRSEIHLKTSYSSTEREIIKVLDLLAQSDAVPVDDIVDTRYSPAEPKDAFEAFANAETIKPVFDLSELEG